MAMVRRSHGNAKQLHAFLPAVASYDGSWRVGLADTRALTCGRSITGSAAPPSRCKGSKCRGLRSRPDRHPGRRQAACVQSFLAIAPQDGPSWNGRLVADPSRQCVRSRKGLPMNRTVVAAAVAALVTASSAALVTASPARFIRQTGIASIYYPGGLRRPDRRRSGRGSTTRLHRRAPDISARQLRRGHQPEEPPPHRGPHQRSRPVQGWPRAGPGRRRSERARLGRPDAGPDRHARSDALLVQRAFRQGDVDRPDAATRRDANKTAGGGQNPIISNLVSVTLLLIRAAVARCHAV